MKERHLLCSFRVVNIILLFLFVSSLLSQVISVVDEVGQGLPGVSIFTEDYSYGTITDEQGNVQLEGINPAESIYFKFLGYDEFQTTINDIATNNYVVTLRPSDHIIEEVVVMGRKEVNQKEIPFQISSININDIKTTNAQTSADALSQHGGVYVQKSQMGGGSPIIRGFEANRVLLVLDGIRLNNAIYRSGHLQNAITVDQAMLERMEVIFGPNSLIYGSDALGGVVNFKTRNPILSIHESKLKTETRYYGRYASANDERSTHLDFSLGSKKFGSLTSLTFSSYGDLRTGNDRDERFPDFGKRIIYQDLASDGTDIGRINENQNIQIGTAYDQFDVFQKFLYTPNIRHRFTANVQFSTSSDVPRYDNLSELRNDQLRWAEWHYGPQKRLLSALDYRHLSTTILYDQLVVIGAYQKIDEDRITRRFENEIRNRQQEDVSIYSLTLDLSKFLTDSEQWELEYGADIQHNIVNSEASSQDITTGAILSNQLTRYASDDNRLTNVGGYVYVKGRSEDQFFFSAGMRLSRSSYQLKYDRNDPVDWPSNFYDGINGSNTAATWSVGGTWVSPIGWQVRSIISTAFRAPNIDDLSKVRINGSEITFPNLDLKPERSTNAELTLAYQSEAIGNFSITGFYTKLNDAIVRSSFMGPQGESIWITQGDTLQIVGNQNIQEGEIYGLSANLSGSISDEFNWESSINYTKGKEILGNGEQNPLSHIPPIYGKIGLGYIKSNLNIKGVVRYNGSKPLSQYGGSADNPDLATPIGTLGWWTINLYTNYKVNDYVELSLSAENILDKHYRPFASGVSAPGRNIIISVRGSF